MEGVRSDRCLWNPKRAVMVHSDRPDTQTKICIPTGGLILNLEDESVTPRGPFPTTEGRRPCADRQISVHHVGQVRS